MDGRGGLAVATPARGLGGVPGHRVWPAARASFGTGFGYGAVCAPRAFGSEIAAGGPSPCNTAVRGCGLRRRVDRMAIGRTLRSGWSGETNFANLGGVHTARQAVHGPWA